MNNVSIYTKTGCPFCVIALKWFDKHKIDYKETVLDNDHKRIEFYESIGNGVSTVPQIFINNNRIGGYSELIKQESYVKHLLNISEN